MFITTIESSETPSLSPIRTVTRGLCGLADCYQPPGESFVVVHAIPTPTYGGTALIQIGEYRYLLPMG